MTKKLLLVGTMASGKSAIVRRAAKEGDFLPCHNSNIGADFRLLKKKDFLPNDIPTEDSLQIWDTSGHDRYLNFIANFVRDSYVIIFVVNLEASAYNNEGAEEDRLRKIAKKVAFSLSGNEKFHILFSKDDLPENQKINSEKKEELVEIIRNELNLYHSVSISRSDCSAKNTNDESIDLLFTKIFRELPEKDEKPPTDPWADSYQIPLSFRERHAEMLWRGIIGSLIASSLGIFICLLFPPVALFFTNFLKLEGIKLALSLWSIFFATGAVVTLSCCGVKDYFENDASFGEDTFTESSNNVSDPSTDFPTIVPAIVPTNNSQDPTTKEALKR